MIETNDYMPQIHSSHFLSGVVEGFYGKPWTTNQRKKLFARMKEFGMNTYLYAPKDDSKHRAYWRILYTNEEGNVLKELIEACNNNNIKFVYAISPGLDITYSNESDVNKLKQKLEQVQQFGCKYFSILFDDIDYEMQPEDKLMFKTFAQAQTYITNLLYKHLNEPELFLFCPTEYCIDMIKSKVLDVNNEYLNTIGSDLLPNIRIMWTGPRVVSPFITIKHIKIVIKLFKRLPLIWDNYHANDYDLKRVFMGPYSSRSINLMNYISGALTNPNCEFESNYIPIYTLAVWSHLKPKHQEQQQQLTTSDNSEDATEPSNFSCFCLDQTYASQSEFDEFEEIESMKESDSFSINYYMNYDEAKYKQIIDNIDKNIDKTTSISIDKLNTNESVNEFFVNNNYLTDCLLNLAIKKWLPVLNENECEQQIYQLNDVIDCDNDYIDSSSLNDDESKHLSKLNSSTKHKAQLDACNSLLSATTTTANNQENENSINKSNYIAHNNNNNNNNCNYLNRSTSSNSSSKKNSIKTNNNNNKKNKFLLIKKKLNDKKSKNCFNRRKRERSDGGELYKLRNKQRKFNSKTTSKLKNRINNGCVDDRKFCAYVGNNCCYQEEPMEYCTLQQQTELLNSASVMSLSPTSSTSSLPSSSASVVAPSSPPLLPTLSSKFVSISAPSSLFFTSIYSSASPSSSSSSSLTRTNSFSSIKSINSNKLTSKFVVRSSPMDLGVENSMTAIPSTAGQPQQQQQKINEINQQQQQQLNEYDLKILIDIFYLPFDFGDYSIYLFKELEHLKQEALLAANNNLPSKDQKINEWIVKYKRYVKVVKRINQIVLKSTNMLNKQLLSEYFQRLFDINCLLSVTVAFLDWLHKHCILGNGDNSTFFLNLTKYLSNSDPLNLNDNQNQPWVKYRGGLYAQLVNVLSFNTIHFPLYFDKQLIRPNYQLVNNLLNSYKIRNYESNDYENICKLFVGNKQQQQQQTSSSYVINSDSLAIGAYLNYSSKHCYLIEDQLNKQIVAVFLAALNVKEFYELCLANWIPKMCDKYPDDNSNDGDYHRKFINFHKSLPFLLPYDDSICSKYVSVGVLKINMMDSIIDKTIQSYLLRQLLSIGLLCLKSQGSIGIYTHLNDTIDQLKEEKMLEKFGFLKLISSNNNNYNNNNNTIDVSSSSSSSSSTVQQNQQHYDVPIYALAI